MAGFYELEVYKKCRTLRNEISQLTKSFPADEKHRLTHQIIRSSRSVTANIAEGHGRFHYQENIQFCRQARGSLEETLDHITVALDERYIDVNYFNEIRGLYDQCMKLLNGYISYLKREKQEA